MRAYTSAAVIIQRSVSRWTSRRADYCTYRLWALSDRQVAPSRTQLEESRASYLKLRINCAIQLCVCVWVYVPVTHTLTQGWSGSEANMQHIKIAALEKQLSLKQTDSDTEMEYWNIGRSGKKRKTQKDGGNERGRSLPIRQPKIALHVWGGDQVAARHQAKLCLSSSGAESEEVERREAGLFRRGRERMRLQQLKCKSESCCVHFLVKHAVFWERQLRLS